MRFEIEPTLASLGVVRKTDREAISEIDLTEWTKMVKFKIVKAVRFTLNDQLQASYFKSHNCLKSDMFSVVEPAKGDVV